MSYPHTEPLKAVKPYFGRKKYDPTSVTLTSILIIFSFIYHQGGKTTLHMLKWGEVFTDGARLVGVGILADVVKGIVGKGGFVYRYGVF